VTRSTIALARRALRNTARRPQFAAPLLLFPTLFLAANVGGLTHSPSLPGFPVVNSFLNFQLAGTMTQALLLGGVSSGIAVALEIEGGFFDRLVLCPIPRGSIVLGRLAATAVLALVQIVYFLVIGTIFGGGPQGGVIGVAAVFAIGLTAAVGFGAVGVTIALRTRSVSTVQGIFPLVLVVLFVSSAFFPRGLLQAPARQIADYNPLSYIADGMREPIVGAASATTVLEGLAAALGLAAATIALAVWSLRTRLRSA
jgi:ABC-2 type transport system permease protein